MHLNYKVIKLSINKIWFLVEEVEEEVKEEESEEEKAEWWTTFVQPEHYEDLKVSSKLLLLFGILKECEQIGDKVYVFIAD